MATKECPLIQKIAVIGAGAVGSTTAYTLMLKNIAAEIILIDIQTTKEEGEVMDMSDGLCYVETGNVACGDFTSAQDADIIVITAGLAQKPGETRLDLIAKNRTVISSIFKQIGAIKPTAIVLMVSNPVDVLTRIAQDVSGLPASQVFGTGTCLDTARLRQTIGSLLHVESSNVHGFVVGEHGDSECIAWSTVTVGGVPVKKLLSSKVLQGIETTVRNKAYEIINRKGATFFGIANVVSDIVEAILFNQHKILPVTSLLSKWNGISNVCLGAPAVIGRTGVEKSWPVSLSFSEKRKIKKSAETLKTYLR